MPHVLSANRLTDGVVVFRAADGAWREGLNHAELLPDAAAAKAALDRALVESDRVAVVDAYSFEVALTPHGAAPTHLRDRIRAQGPTITFDTGAQPR